MEEIRYIKDKDLTYLKDIREGLQAYNKMFTGEKKQDVRHFYVFDDETLIGACSTEMGWDWAFISHIFYNDETVLRLLLNEVSEYYNGAVTGIQYFTSDQNRINSFISNRYYSAGQLIDMPKGQTMHYLMQTDLSSLEVSTNYIVITNKEKIEDYHNILLEKEKQHNNNRNYNSKKEEIVYAVLNKDTCIGGVYGYYKDDYLYVSFLFVNEEYRGRKIASKLMDLIEEDSKDKKFTNVYLSTCEFQALDFYLKRGYNIIAEVKDYPKGYKEYTLSKTIK